MPKFEPPENEEERRAWIKRLKAQGVRAFKGRYGWAGSAVGTPKNPRTADQQSHRRNLRLVSARWHTLNPDQEAAWRALAAQTDFITDTGARKRRNCYTLFVSLNTRRADLGLSQFDVPPAKPVFPTNLAQDLALTYTDGKLALKVRLDGTPTHLMLVQGARPVRSSVRCVQHFPLLGLLPPPVDGWSDITDLYVARYGVPKPNQAIWIRICQHIDGFIDVPREFRVRVKAPAA
jgi:hypothetical protein